MVRPPNHDLLGIGNKEEGQVLPIEEHPEPSSDHRVAAGSIGKADSRLKFVVVIYHECRQSGFHVPSQAIIQREFGIELPLVLGKHAPVSVVNIPAEAVKE